MVFSIQNAEEEIKLFKNSAKARLVRLEGGVHFLSATHAREIHRELLGFVQSQSRNGGSRGAL